MPRSGIMQAVRLREKVPRYLIDRNGREVVLSPHHEYIVSGYIEEHGTLFRQYAVIQVEGSSVCLDSTELVYSRFSPN